jgi:hypothetical protein
MAPLIMPGADESSLPVQEMILLTIPGLLNHR